MAMIAGRLQEQQIMHQLLHSDRSEFLVIYGRRRIGKTFLVRNVYEFDLTFQMTGMADVATNQQLANFASALRSADPDDPVAIVPPDWFSAFERLRRFLEKNERDKKVVFFDELPWFDTLHSNFLSALEHFWNAWASARNDIILVVCGSAASWIINKLINNKGGLHNRLTKRIRLEPFTLQETETFFQLKGIELDRYQIVQLYMAMGGIPFYLNEIIKGRSAFQEIDRLCFSPGGLLVSEYQNLYRSLFNTAERHMIIVETLANNSRGMTRRSLILASGLSNGGSTTKALLELEESGFITRVHPFAKKIKEAVYRLSDQYSLFYLKFMQDKKAFGQGSWISRLDSPAWRAWSGLAFENICFLHLENIKKALGISGVYTEISAWSNSEQGVQIDLLIDRRDHVISLCEIKFSKDPYAITKSYKQELEKKISAFRTTSKTRKAIFLTMLTPFGVEENKYSIGFVQNSVTMEDLFD
jgi:uncharacterized protein